MALGFGDLVVAGQDGSWSYLGIHGDGFVAGRLPFKALKWGSGCQCAFIGPDPDDWEGLGGISCHVAPFGKGQIVKA